MPLNDNTAAVNKILARTLGWCFLSLIALMITNWIGIFHFKGPLKVVIFIFGTAATLVPALLHLLKVNDTFLKYYMFIALSLLIGLMGTNNGIGIYITYALVPIASCMYFDRRFLLHISIFSYLTMSLGVLVNTANKLERYYYNWSHLITFRNYMIGFTIEYIVVMVFLFQIVNRAQQFMEQQSEHLQILEEDRKRRDNISLLYKNTISGQRRTTFDLIASASENYAPEDYTRLAAGHQYIAQLQGILNYSEDQNAAYERVLESIGEYFRLDRILYVEPSAAEGVDFLRFQWVRNEADRLYDFYTGISPEDVENISATYDAEGYIEYGSDYAMRPEYIDCGLTGYMVTKMLGRNLWLPTVSNGEYVGAFCFDKRDADRYNPIDIFLLSEVVNILSNHLIRQKADQANRAKSIFLSTMSHEIRTPMNAIIGMTTVSLREEMSDSLRKNLSIIKSSSEGLLGIINDILDFSKIESGKVELINENYHMNTLLNDLEVIVNARNEEKQLEINYDFDPNMPSVLYGDILRVKQVMINLANNAIKYTEHGSVSIRINTKKREENIILLCFEVSDTGQGIREEDLEHLFQSFSQMNQKQNHHTEGTGLGLAISKQLVELMHGQISVKSTYGKGSTFSFELPQRIVDETPYTQESNVGCTEDDSDLITFTSPASKVLLVDDNLVNLIVAQSLLEPFEMQISTATGGIEAIEKTKTQLYDIIFMDHFMPDLDGEEATKEIRSNPDNPNCETVIIALTADAVLGAKEHMLASGMNDFLSKPIDLKETKHMLKKYLPPENIQDR